MSREYEESPLTPPDALRVAKRAIVLASCGCRAHLESHPKDSDALCMHDDLQEWIDEIGVRDEFEEKEWKGIVTPLGALSERMTVDFSWRVEGLVVLAWALGRADLPPYDEQADGPAVGDTIGFLDDSVEEMLRSSMLRSAAELDWFANFTRAIHWRLRNYTMKPAAFDFRAIAKSITGGVFPTNDLKLIDNDLALRGKSVAKASQDVFEACISIASERQQAANWLIAQETIYSEVTCDT